MQRTHLELQQAREAVDLDTIESLSVAELRKLAAHVAVGAIVRDGEKVSVSKGRKTELVHAIREVCTLEVKSTAIDPVVEDFENTGVGELAKRVWSDLHRDADRRVNHLKPDPVSGSPYFRPDAHTVTIAYNTVLEVRQWRSTKTGNVLTDSTVMDYTRKCARVIKNEIVPLYSHLDPALYAHYVETAQAFETGVKQLTDEARLARQKATDKQYSAESQNQTIVQYSSAVVWAKGILHSLDSVRVKDWTDVVVALQIATGRRQSEITSSAVFEPEADSPNWVNFTGQLKTRGREVGTFRIPLLVEASAVINGLKWLSDNGKRRENPNEAHNLFSRYVSAKAKEVFYKHVPLVEAGAVGEDTNAHLFRALYAVVSTEIMKPSNRESKPFFARTILGEANDNTATIYLNKFVVQDINRIREIVLNSSELTLKTA